MVAGAEAKNVGGRGYAGWISISGITVAGKRGKTGDLYLPQPHKAQTEEDRELHDKRRVGSFRYLVAVEGLGKDKKPFEQTWIMFAPFGGVQKPLSLTGEPERDDVGEGE